MKSTVTKSLPALVAALLISGVAASANGVVRRIDHPNGAPTFVANKTARNATIAVYSKGRGISSDRADAASSSNDRVIRVQTGRGQYTPVRTAR